MALPLFLGFQVRLDQSRMAMAPPPKADGRLKDATKIQEDLIEKRARQAEELVNVPFYGTLTRICVFNLEGKTELDLAFTNGQGFETAITLLNNKFLQGRDDMTTPILGFGFNALDRLRQLAIEGARLGIPLNAHLWHHNHMSPHVIVDPFDYILKKEHQAHLPVSTFCNYIGHPVPPGLYEDAGMQAAYARALVLAVGLEQ